MARMDRADNGGAVVSMAGSGARVAEIRHRKCINSRQYDRIG